jgi:hypothetical protein
MTEISKARQALRDYALTAHAVQLNQVLGCAWVADPPDIPDGLTISISRGEAGAKAFVAVQAVLTLLEKEREGHKRWEGDPASDTALILIEDIETAVLKALES